MNIDALINKLTSALAYGNRPRPYRDWFIILAASVLIVTASFAWNTWLFLRVASGESLGGTAPAPTAPAFSAAPLEAVDALFANRAEESVRYKSQYPFVDPSK